MVEIRKYNIKHFKKQILVLNFNVEWDFFGLFSSLVLISTDIPLLDIKPLEKMKHTSRFRKSLVSNPNVKLGTTK